uniref:peroxidase n=1 Tax=Lotus japonicus TaxID=34305 RepID=I3T832_LOTJA|nr:unknown [Lotus japonicus]
MASSSFVTLLLISSFLSFSHIRVSEAATAPIVKGLSWTFYDSSCPKLESIIRKELKKVFDKDIAQAAGLLRLHFHDCFVQGCDASVLLDGSASGPSEKDAPPNLTLRAQAFKIIEDLRSQIEKKCGRVVSCADITAIAARDAVFLSGGPDYELPLGRRDGLNFATRNVTLDNLPAPQSNTTAILNSLATKNLMNRQGLFFSDQSLFFEKFVVAMLKMGQLNVLTGSQGEIRANCSVRNADKKKSFLTTVVEEVVEELIEM